MGHGNHGTLTSSLTSQVNDDDDDDNDDDYNDDDNDDDHGTLTISFKTTRWKDREQISEVEKAFHIRKKSDIYDYRESKKFSGCLNLTMKSAASGTSGPDKFGDLWLLL